MKIAFVSDAIYPYNKGGKEKRLFDISTRLAQRGHDVHIYCMKWWDGKEIEKIENGVYLHAISKYYPLYSGERRSIKEGVLFGLSCLKLLSENWDVVDVDHMPFFPLFSVKIISILKKKRMFATWLEVWGRNYWVKYMGSLGNFAYLIEKLAVLTPDKIISISDRTTNKLINDLRSKKDIVTIPVGIDLDYIYKLEPSPIKSDIIFVGRLLSHKNIEYLIRSVSIIKEKEPYIKCLIIGDGPERERLEKLSEKLRLSDNINFFGFIEKHEEVLSLMKSSKVFVLPSTREGFGIVVIEANACGIPVITINHKDNAAKDLTTDGVNGHICQLDESSMANMITKTIQERLINKNQQIYLDSVKKYDWMQLMREIEEAYLK